MKTKQTDQRIIAPRPDVLELFKDALASDPFLSKINTEFTSNCAVNCGGKEYNLASMGPVTTYGSGNMQHAVTKNISTAIEHIKVFAVHGNVWRVHVGGGLESLNNKLALTTGWPRLILNATTYVDNPFTLFNKCDHLNKTLEELVYEAVAAIPEEFTPELVLGPEVEFDSPVKTTQLPKYEHETMSRFIMVVPKNSLKCIFHDRVEVDWKPAIGAKPSQTRLFFKMAFAIENPEHCSMITNF